MKRSVAAVLAGTAVCGLVTAGITGQASAAEDPYPESDGWVQIQGQLTIPAGYACKAQIVEDFVGHVRTFTLSERRSFDDWGEDSRVTFTNSANGKSVVVDASGDVLYRTSEDGKTLWLTSLGGSAFFGKGVKGIVYGDGVQKVRVTQADTEDPTGYLRIVNGARRQLCHELGSRAVRGRNLPLPAPDLASAARSVSVPKAWWTHR